MGLVSLPGCLEERVFGPLLSEEEGREHVEQKQVHQPHKEGTHGLQDGAEHGAEVVWPLPKGVSQEGRYERR